MWFEDRSKENHGYKVATSDRPDGSFSTVRTDIQMPGTDGIGIDLPMPGKGRTGDYFLFVDDDDTAYHIRMLLVAPSNWLECYYLCFTPSRPR